MRPELKRIFAASRRRRLLEVEESTSDDYFANVQLLLDADGSDGSTTLSDLSPNDSTVSFDTNAELDTADKKFGTASILVDNTAGTAVSVPVADGLNTLNLTDGFTVEAFIKGTTLAGTIASSWTWATQTGRSWWWGAGADGLLAIYLQDEPSGGGNWSTVPGVISTGTWHHTVFQVQPAGNMEMFVDGSQVMDQAPTGVSALKVPTVDFCVGATSDSNDVWDGWIDSVRVTAGVARYTDGYDVPTAAFPTS